MQFDYNLRLRAEKKSLVHDGNVIGGCLVIGNIVCEIAIFVLSAICMLLLSFVSGGEFGNINTVDNPIYLYALNAVLEFLMYFCVFYVMMKLTRRPIGDTVGTGSPNNKRYMPFLIGFAMFFILFGIFLSDATSLFFENLFHLEPVQPDYGELETTPFTFVFIMITDSVVPAFVEEFSFRGATLGMLRRFGDVPAIIVSSIMFSLIHGNFDQIPYTFCLAIGLGILRCVTDSIWPCVFCHFLNNTVATIATVLPQNASTVFQLVFFAVICIFGIISIAVVSEKKLLSSLYKPNLATKPSSRVVRIICSPFMIIAIVIYLVTAFQYFTAV